MFPDWMEKKGRELVMKGKGFMLLGVLLVAAAIGLSIYNVYSDEHAESKSEEIIELLQEEVTENKEEIIKPIKTAKREIPTVKIDKDRYIGILEIPQLGLELPIMDEWDYKKLKVSPCRYTGSPYQNDLVIVAHNYRSHFGKINDLPAGAEVIYTDAEGTMFQYEVAGLEIIEATDIEGMINSEWDLTLFTCTYGGAQRYAVRCNSMIK